MGRRAAFAALALVSACRRADSDAPPPPPAPAASSAPPVEPPPPPEATIVPVSIDRSEIDDTCAEAPELEDAVYRGAPTGAGPKIAATLPSIDGEVIRVFRTERVELTDMKIESRSSDNGVFAISGRVSGRRDPRGFVLVVCGRAVPVEGWGGNATEGTQTVDFFDVRRKLAERAAASFHVTLAERKPLGEGVHARFVAPPPVARGEPVPVEIAFENRGAEAVVFREGSSGSGRNSSFDFEVRRGGAPLERKRPPRHDFGGHVSLVNLAPGGQQSLTVDARLWADFDEPGEYEVACRYDLVFQGPDRRDAWHARATQTVRVVVR